MMELVQQLAAGTGVSRSQAEGGAGLLLSQLKNRCDEEAYALMAEAMPEAEYLIALALHAGVDRPESINSELGNTDLAGLAQLASGFSRLGLDIGMIGSFTPILIAYLQARGGAALASMARRLLSDQGGNDGLSSGESEPSASDSRHPGPRIVPAPHPSP